MKAPLDSVVAHDYSNSTAAASYKRLRDSTREQSDRAYVMLI